MNNQTIGFQLEAAIRQCNDGVVLLSTNDFEAATSCFSSSLRLAKQILENATTTQLGTHDEHEAAHPSAVKSGSLIDCCMHASSRAVGHKNKLFPPDVNGAASQYIYRQAIRFVPNGMIPQEFFQARSNIHTVGVVLSTMNMFNLALAYQLSAGNNGSVAKLRSSLKLYELAFTFLHTEQEEPILQADSVLFTMAILNNSGLIYQQLGNHEASQQYFEQLLGVIMFVIDYGRAATNGSSIELSREQLEGFLTNTPKTFSKPRTAPAA